MLKVKRPVHSKNSTSQIDEWENDIKNSIKNMYIQNQKDTDLIHQHENALQKLKQEYTLLYKENQELKKTVQEMKQSEQSASSTNENLRKRPLSKFDYENEYDENEYVRYIVRKKRKIPKKRIIYEEEEEDESNSENDEIDGESRRRANEKMEETIEKKRIKKPSRKGISKTIKM